MLVEKYINDEGIDFMDHVFVEWLIAIRVWVDISKFTGPASNHRAQLWTGGGNYQMEYGRGRGNFRWSGEMRRDRKEHQRRKHSAGPKLTLRDES
ncbi:hypothetical protein QVD17_20815 [Tagetes erecta]|uniref:Uncharacterized protein n=1 Tax=Tagetes erecta TaxID=13708 RepID=A0AAD8NXK4_TARER|nr:hypothetical protein QVD17_20815 [Tagetes erecta]